MINNLIQKYKNKKGFISIYTMIMIAFLLPFLMFTAIDLNHFMQQNRHLKNLVDNAGASAITMVDDSKIPKGIIAINSKDAQDIVINIIRQQLFLNEDLTPKPESILSEKPTIIVHVLNTGDSVVTPLGTTTAVNPSVVVYAKFPVKGLFFHGITLNIEKEGMSQAQFR